MTIIAIHYNEKNIFAIADGLISRGASRVIEQDQKIVMFSPCYKIPKVSLGHFDGFGEYGGGSFCIAYAGNFSLASTIVKRFINIVTRLLVIDRDFQEGGKPTIYERENSRDYFRSASYWDDYNFTQDELLPITVNFLMNILQRVCEISCSDFSRNAMMHPDVQFLLFGAETVNHKSANRVQVIKCTTDIGIFERFSVTPWSLACIGDATVIPNLIEQVESSSRYATRPSSKKDPVKIGEFEIGDWMHEMSILEEFCSNRERVIKENVLSLIANDTGTIGGDCTIAQSSWSKRLELKTIRNSTISQHISA